MATMPRLGVQNLQFDNVYNMAANADPMRDAIRGAGQIGAKYMDRKRAEEDAAKQQAIADKNAMPDLRAREFISNYGEGYMSGKTDPGAFVSGLSEFNPALAMKLESARRAQAQSGNAYTEDDRIATEARSIRNLMLSDRWNNLDPAMQKEYTDRLNAYDQRLASSSRYGYGTIGLPGSSAQDQAQKDAPTVGKQSAFNYDAAKSAGVDIINKTDDPKTNEIEGVAAAKEAITRMARAAGIAENDRDFMDALKYIDAIAAERYKTNEGVYSRTQQAKSEGRAAANDRISQDEKFQPLWTSIQALKSNPNVSNVRAALNLALRKETGAVIGADEFENMMSTVLPESDYRQFKAETQGLKNTLLGMASDTIREQELQRTVERYLNRVNPDRLYNYVDSKVPKDYYQRNTSLGKNTPAQSSAKVGKFTVKKRGN